MCVHHYTKMNEASTIYNNLQIFWLFSFASDSETWDLCTAVWQKPDRSEILAQPWPIRLSGASVNKINSVLKFLNSENPLTLWAFSLSLLIGRDDTLLDTCGHVHSVSQNCLVCSAKTSSFHILEMHFGERKTSFVCFCLNTFSLWDICNVFQNKSRIFFSSKQRMFHTMECHAL